ncbi:MAG: tetratricopeptide repeat protein [Myxococcota bacterium]
MHQELIRLIVAYTLVGVFVLTAVFTTLSMVGVIEFAHKRQQQTLFAVLIVEVVAVALGFFTDFLEFDPQNVTSLVVDAELRDRRAIFEDRLGEARTRFDHEDFAEAYSIANGLFRSPELEEYFPIRDLFVLSGDIARKRSFWAEATEHYGPALKLDPSNVDVMINSGFVHRVLENYEEAEKLYERAIAVDPQRWGVLNGYFNCLRRYAASLAEGYPRASDEKFERAQTIVEQMANVASSNDERQKSLIAKGVLYWEWKKYDVATTVYRDLVSRYPETRRFREDLAAILVERGEFKEATRLFEALYDGERGTGTGAVSFFVASGFAEASARGDASRPMLKRGLEAGLLAIAADPAEPFGYYAVALAYRRLGDRSKALTHIHKAVEKERDRETNVHTYDRDRHVLYKQLAAEWAPAKS